jgi:amino acid adenylation domain-containing protein
VEWNATAVDYPDDLCVHQLFEQQVEHDPNAVAVVHADRSLSYGELNARSNRLAHHLRGSGVGPDVLVAICVERSLEMVVGLLAILKAGGAYVPLDPSYPAERLAFMMRDSAPAVILSHAPARAALEAAVAGLAQRPSILDLETDAHQWAEQPGTNLDPAAAGLMPCHLAYVIYTSGSTGTPKGVMTEHRALVNRLKWMQDAYGLTRRDTVLQKTPFSFDVSVWEFFWPLGSGAKLAIAPPGTHLDPAQLAHVINEQRVTTAHFVPSMLLKFLEHSATKRDNTLVRVISSGEALSLSLVEKLHETLDRTDLHNLYGPTEAAIDVTAWTTSAGQLPPGATSPPIGRPISNTRIYLLDGSMEPVPVGVAGEIYIGGAGVARGYLNRPELTAERFVASPFVEGDRLYKTGDLGRYLADANIEFLGRNDFQVKIRGCRIELGEIEARLSSYPGMREAVVLARADEAGDQRLAAYYTAAGPDAPETEALRAHLAAGLPEFMVPAAFVRLEKLPLTANGKIDRSALPAPDQGAYARPIYEAPVGSVEAAIAGIWAEVLGLDRFGRHDNFFDLGGHSLRAVQLLVEINRSFGRQLPLTMIYDAPTIAALASILNSDLKPQFSPVVDLRPGKTFPALFIVCGAGGNSMELAAPARHISGDRQIYGLQEIWLDSVSHPHDRIEDMADYYARHIEELQPNGPYLLAGLSFGGLVALEIAHRLRRSGEEVALLAFLDTLPHPRFMPLSFLLAHWKRRIREHTAVAAQLPLRKIAPYAFRRLIGLREPIRARYLDGFRQPASDSALPEGLPAVLDAAYAARRRYRPRYYPRTLTLLKAQKTGGFWQSYAAFWAQLAAAVDVRIVPGSHSDMVANHADSLGAQLSLCIERALGSEQSRSTVGSATAASRRERMSA